MTAMNFLPQSHLKLDRIPRVLTWNNAPLSWSYAEGILMIRAGEKTDLFLDPRHEYSALNSPRVTFIPETPFTLSARAKVGFKQDYDAAVLVLFANDKRWAKLCLEYSPQRNPTIVSVVTNVISDDSNHATVGDRGIYLRISGLGDNTFAFHYSENGSYWHLVRYFHLDAADPVEVGFSSQSPTGRSCEARFSEIEYSNRKPADLRNGQ